MSSSIMFNTCALLTDIPIPSVCFFIILSRVKCTSLNLSSFNDLHKNPTVSRENYTQIKMPYRVFARKSDLSNFFTSVRNLHAAKLSKSTVTVEILSKSQLHPEE